MAGDQDSIDQPLEQTLERILGDAERICQGVDLHDPDTIEHGIGEGCDRLRDLLAQLMANPLRPDAADLDAGALVHAATERVRQTTEIPFQLELRHAPPVPVPAELAARVAVVLEPLLELAARAAGAGGTVSVEVASATPLLVAVEVRAAAELVAPCPGEWLRELARELGFELEAAAPAADRVALRLRQPS